MSKIWFLAVSLGIYQLYLHSSSGNGSGRVNPDEICGRWSNLDGSMWFEFYQNSLMLGNFIDGEFKGSYQELRGGQIEISVKRKAEKLEVFLRDQRLVCIDRHLEYKLKKVKEFSSGTVQRK